MQVRELLRDDDAVSPVIGVILMVAITVILAAVIASFVLGLGNQQTQNPQASFSWDYEQLGTDGDTEYGVVSVTHDGGDSIPSSEVYFRGSGWTSKPSSSEYPSSNILKDGGQWYDASDVDEKSEVSSGMTAKLGVDSDFDMRLVWEPAEGDTSATLSSETGPDA